MGSLELHEPKKDLGEAHNLVREMPEKAAAMHRRLFEWEKDVGANIPLRAKS